MGKNRITLAIGIFALALVVSSSIYFQSNSNRELEVVDLSSTSPNPEAEYRGPLDDCLENATLYRRKSHLTSQCTMNYVHFFPDNIDVKSAETTKGDIKIGSYNLFHMGDNQSAMKNFPLVAKIMNQWDVVGVQEMMPLPGEWAVSNQKTYELLSDSQGKTITFPYDNWVIAKPGYLKLLSALQALDPSWAVILQPMPEGEGSSGEMAGFYYRSKRVRLKEWGYCPSDRSVDIKTNERAANFGCLLQIPEDQRKLMSRVAFTAYFQAGNFDFVGVTTHVRFRAADQEADLKEQRNDLCSFHANESACKPNRDEVGRFFEVTAIANQFKSIREIARDKDVIFTGDFNLELDPKNQDLWDAALKPAPGFVVTQTAKTTLTVKNEKLASNYDHFILDPKATSECDVKTIRAFDVTTADTSSDPVMKEIAKFLSAGAQQSLLNDAQNVLGAMIKFQPGKDKDSGGVRALTDAEKNGMTKSLADSVERMKTNKYGALMELLSDHIPIEMKCHIPTSDDD